MMENRGDRAIALLKDLIAIPSLSGEEGVVADRMERFLEGAGASPQRTGNNVWAEAGNRESPFTLLLNSHLDTVPPASDYTKDPHEPTIEGERLYGLGSNDAGASLVAMAEAFSLLLEQPPNCRVIYAASAEEETSGAGGIPLLLPELGQVDFAIVGEPTLLMAAVAERGLMVLDCTAAGRSGHAARGEGLNAIYEALPDLEWFRTYRFDETSPTLGEVRMTVTAISAGGPHNVVPDRCRFTVDVRTTDRCDNETVLRVARENVSAEISPRSLRLKPSGLPDDHFAHAVLQDLGLEPYGSPTLSDQARMPFDSIKLGPGDSARSHTPDEWVGLQEIRDAVDLYIKLVHALSERAAEQTHH